MHYSKRCILDAGSNITGECEQMINYENGWFSVLRSGDATHLVAAKIFFGYSDFHLDGKLQSGNIRKNKRTKLENKKESTISFLLL